MNLITTKSATIPHDTILVTSGGGWKNGAIKNDLQYVS